MPLLLILPLLALIALFLYWQLVWAEGSYLGKRPVAWLYNAVAHRYNDIKQYTDEDDARFLGEPLALSLQGTPQPMVLDVATGTSRLPLALCKQPLFRGQIIALLSRCDQDDPVVRDLAHIVAGDSTPSDGLRDPYQRLKARLRRFYDRLVARRWFRRALVAYLAVLALSGVLSAIGVTAIAIWQGDSIALDFWDYGQLISASISATLIVVGFVRWRRSRLTAYRWFERGLLVSLFVTQFFAFYNNQTTQAFNVIVILLTYAAVKGMIVEEEARQVGGDEAQAEPATA